MIDPWSIYLISIADSIHHASTALFCITIPFFLIFAISFGMSILELNIREETKKFLGRALRVSTLALAINIATFCFFPSKETMCTVLVFNQLTPENIESLKNFGIVSVQQFSDTLINNINRLE